jgi:hypothetical protein
MEFTEYPFVAAINSDEQNAMITTAEYASMYFICGYNRNATAALKEYQHWHPNKR